MFGDNTQKFLNFISDRFDSHSICDEQALYDLCKIMDWKYTTELDGKGTKQYKTVTIDIPNFKPIHIYCSTNASYQQTVQNEGRGGYMRKGDNFCFEPYDVIRSLAGLINYSTWKMGRGSGYRDNLSAILSYGEKSAAI